MDIFPRQRIYFFFFAFIFIGCSQQKLPNVDRIDLEVKIKRFDQQINLLTKKNASEKNREWQISFPHFYSDFTNFMLEAGDPRDTQKIIPNLHQIAENEDFIALKESVSETFPSLEKQEAGLTDAFKRIKYYFQQSKTPTFISFFSGFSIQVPVGDNYIGIGLDMFLGKDSPYYPSLRESIPYYISKRFTPEHIVPRVTETFIRQNIFPEPDHFKSFLDNMVYEGKILYLMDLTLPITGDTLKIGYDTSQLTWANEYQTSIWAYFISENLLFETDALKTKKYIVESPFTPGLGDKNQSAPKLGRFIGWQIVRNYMKENPETTPATLLSMNDSQKLLKDSKYKGK